MTIPVSPLNKKPVSLCLLAVLVLALLTGGCTQPALQQQQQEQKNAPAIVTVVQTDNTHLTLTYPGSTETGTLLELETTVTDSAGKTQTKSIGDRQSTTPLKFGATQVLTGTFDGTDRVTVTGYFMDGSQRHILDTTV